MSKSQIPMRQSASLSSLFLATTIAITNSAAVNAAVNPLNIKPDTPDVSATGGVFIDNGTVQLGVHAEAQLNVTGGPRSLGGTTTVGLRYLPTGAEATAPGCFCEGWGVGDEITGVSGSANENNGIFNITPIEFVVTESTAFSDVQVGETFRVVHDYRPSPDTAFLYEVEVSVTNISDAETHLRYRRAMDWDIEPTAFAEYVTIQGSESAEAVIFASDDGFADTDPFAGDSSILFTGDAIDSGPADHGALFDFDFGMLQAGDTFSFNIYYGAAGSEEDALGALSAVGAEAYSLGQPSGEGGADLGEPNTFIFAFADVGGPAVFPPGATSLISPSGDYTSEPVNYSWDAVAGAEQYLLWIQNDDTREYTSTWYTSADAGCDDDSDVCEISSISEAVAAAGALYGDVSITWWVRTWNSAGLGPWSEPLNYRIIEAEGPGDTTALSPSGEELELPEVKFEWTAADGATWYKVQVWEVGASDSILNQWYRDIDITCTESGICSVSETLPLSSSVYRWRVKGWNNAGLGPWSNIQTFSPESIAD